MLTVLTLAAALAAPPLALPEPTGTAAVGTQRVAFGDRVGVTLHYPRRTAGGRAGGAGQYLSPRASAALLRFQVRHQPDFPDLPPHTFARVRTGAVRGGAVAPGRHPLVLLSPGFSFPAATLTGLATDLAAHGYVVASLDHPGEAAGIQLGDRVLPCSACDTDDYAGVARGRARDATFVLDKLLAPGSGWRRAIDPRRIGMAGHSIGGNAAAVALTRDRRVRAAVDLDGTLFAPVRRTRRSLLLMGTPQHRPHRSDASWDRTFGRLQGRRAWITVRRTAHLSFTDLPVLAGQLGLENPLLGGGRTMRITRAITRTFLDRELRGASRPLPRFPETTRHF